MNVYIFGLLLLVYKQDLLFFKWFNFFAHMPKVWGIKLLIRSFF